MTRNGNVGGPTLHLNYHILAKDIASLRRCSFRLALRSLMLDGCDQEKHRAARFVLPCGMHVQQFLRRLRFGEPGNGETGVKHRIHIGGDGAVIFDHLMPQKSGLALAFLLILIERPM